MITRTKSPWVEFVPMTDERRLRVLNMCLLALGNLNEHGRFGYDPEEPILTFEDAVCVYGASMFVEPEEVRQVMSESLVAQFIDLLATLEVQE